MAHEVLYDLPIKKEKHYNVKMPNLEGKFGISLCIAKKEFFLGIAIANIEMETIVRKKKVKLFKAKSRSKFIPL